MESENSDIKISDASKIKDKLQSGILNILSRYKDLPFELTSVDDFTKISRAYESLMRSSVIMDKIGAESEKLSWAEILQLIEKEDNGNGNN